MDSNKYANLVARDPAVLAKLDEERKRLHDRHPHGRESEKDRQVRHQKVLFTHTLYIYISILYI